MDGLQRANYEIALSDASIDNPDQRIQDDVPVVIGMKDGAGIGVFSFLSSITLQVMSLLGYISILWGVSANIKVFGVAVPGLLVWVALIWSAVATYLTFRIGRRMVPLSVAQQHLEADYRFSLARPREYAEEIAMMRGGQREYQGISQRFSLVTGNAYTLVGMNTLLSTLNTVLAAVRDNLHYVLLVPLVISHDLTLGQMTMAEGAFSFVNAVFGFFISYFTSIAQFRAALNRLSSFDAALDKASANTVKGQVTQGHSDAFVLKEVSIMRPDESVMMPPISLVLRGGCNVFVSGPSGSGKSTLFRVLAGIWPFWHGQLELPAARRVLILPQASYIPIGSLLNAITYPDAAESHSRQAIAQVLDMVGLGKLVERLDAVEPWPMQLSGG